MKHYQIQPNEFLKFVHDVDLSKLKKCSNLFKEINQYQEEKLFIPMVIKIMQKKFSIHWV